PRSSTPFSLYSDQLTIKLYTPSLHDALPISSHGVEFDALGRDAPDLVNVTGIVCDDGPQGSGRDFLSFFIIKPNAAGIGRSGMRSEEHTSELQSRFDLVCRLLLEKKKKKQPS